MASLSAEAGGSGADRRRPGGGLAVTRLETGAEAGGSSGRLAGGVQAGMRGDDSSGRLVEGQAGSWSPEGGRLHGGGRTRRVRRSCSAPAFGRALAKGRRARGTGVEGRRGEEPPAGRDRAAVTGVQAGGRGHASPVDVGLVGE
ncbi:hypothetical protein J5N97_020439 [Dioscorea zingiberensis]|uniref:Uncharacterized protein n=1 Tax=Dioscorea zingiberensis TaxID=325984 RepID=A0A9D5HDN4_9LILI|nr:hypothetical protein J5N97_020439 [Dioscorea zingiberensis]